MDVFDDFTNRIKKHLQASVIKDIVLKNADLQHVSVEAPRDAAHGDLSSNAAMVLAKPAGLKPREIAEVLAAALAQDSDVTDATIAGPGFVNFSLRDAFWHRLLVDILEHPQAYGGSPRNTEDRVNVEYVSANPTGPMHVGHGRGAVVGDAIAALLARTGMAVTKEYYINDAGAQVDVLARSVYLRYREALGTVIDAIPEGLYPGDYLIPVGEALARDYGDRFAAASDESAWLPLFRQRAIDAMMDLIREDLAALGIVHDVYFSEQSLGAGHDDQITESLEELRRQNLVYVGRLPPPKGQTSEEWEDREQTLFASTRFGDDVDRPLLKSDGGFTYFASDIAYHRSKYRRGFNRQVDIWGADHGGYVKRMKAAVTAISGGKADLDIVLTQLVRLFRAGEPVLMSKRSGQFVTLREVIDEVGCDAVRFMMLMRKSDAPLDFDLAKVVEQSKDNPVFYVQYAHARAHSVYRNAREIMPDIDPYAVPDLASVARLTEQQELGLIKLLAAYPRMISSAANAREPHRIAFYLYELASQFHGLWNRGKDMPQLRFINSDDRLLTVARLALVRAVECVLASGLGILGVSAPQEMR